MGKRIQALVGLAITAVCFWWTFRNTNWDELWASLRAAKWVLLIPYVLTALLFHVLRTVRWGNLLSGLEKVSFRALFEATSIGVMLLVVLPFRLGELARPFLIAERSGIRRPAAMTTIVLERIIDGLFIAVLFRVLLFFVPGEAASIEWVRAGSNLMFAVFTSGLAFLLLARWQEKRVTELLRAVLGRVSAKLADKVVDVVGSFVSALRQAPDAKNFALYFVWTSLYWGINGLGISMLAQAFDLPIGPFEGFVVLCVAVLGVMVPAAPGSAGTYQAAVLVSLGLFMPATQVSSAGVAFVNVMWLTGVAVQIGVGLVMVPLTGRSLKGISGQLKGA